MMKLLGIMLVTLSIFAFAYQGWCHADPFQVAESSPLGLIVPESQSFWILPVMGVIELSAGLSLLFTPKTWI